MFKGAMTAIITPFDASNRLDEEGLRQNIRFQLDNGINGIVALGTTGESPTLTAKEKARIIEITADEVDERVPVIIGTGSYSTDATIENTLQAKSMGAHAALIVTPYYNKPPQEGLYQHYARIADAVDLPILIYNNPTRTGQSISTSTIKRLAEHPRIVGIKDSSGSILQMMDIYESVCLQREDFSLLSGDDPLTFACMAIGGHGTISVLSNLLPSPLVTMVQALQQGQYDEARAIHYKLQPLIKALFSETNPMPLKAAMEHLGMAAGSCRAPLCEIQAETKEQLIKTLDPALPLFTFGHPFCR